LNWYKGKQLKHVKKWKWVKAHNALFVSSFPANMRHFVLTQSQQVILDTVKGFVQDS
jgi:hypothetical protein